MAMSPLASRTTSCIQSAGLVTTVLVPVSAPRGGIEEGPLQLGPDLPEDGNLAAAHIEDLGLAA